MPLWAHNRESSGCNVQPLLFFLQFTTKSALSPSVILGWSYYDILNASSNLVGVIYE